MTILRPFPLGVGGAGEALGLFSEAREGPA